MAVEMDTSSGPYKEFSEIPIGTFRHYINFIVKHELWDEVTSALQAAGMRSVVLTGAQVNIIRQFVDAKGAELRADPQPAGTLVVPECSILCPPAQFPHGGGSPPDAGTSPEAGTPPATMTADAGAPG